MMTMVTRLLVFITLSNLVICTGAAPFLSSKFLEFFGNPVRDFVDTFNQQFNITATNVTITESAMIEVPFNTAGCTPGAQKDAGGVCRQTW